MSRNLLPDFSGGLIASGLNRGIPLFVGASTIIAFVALALALVAPVFAQTSLDSSSAPPTDYAVPPPSDGSLVEPSIPGETTTNDVDSDDDGTASSDAAAPAPHAAANPVAPAASGSAVTAKHSGWNRVSDVDEDTPKGEQSDKVLEVPQVLPPVNPQPSVDADETAPDGGNDGNQLADQSPPPEQVGSIDDYQDEEESAIVGVFVVPVPLGAVGISPYGMNVFQPSPFNPGFGTGFVPGFTPFVPSTTALRPFGGGMNSAIMPTSPMFPRSRIFSGGFMAPRGAMHFSGGGFGRGH
jgi:hypothetical protein